ncbi:hypothetical protein SG34_024855 [Thalassomonas viridans]|uniref:Uncharacterized protein n=1 Tax=Thalassomonas viridans TaxID=137584 RepID=A0AAE9Z0E9_9GAMM|nr:hypothetical protein [Thalassomonas viridans]WDE04526.1 hypothetical protein SG34_024855 [Thalassomonas viridans]
MKIFKVGDTQLAVCEACRSIKSMTFALRDVPFSDGSGIVKNVLVGVCDTCDYVIVTPQQSAPAIKRELDKQRKPLEARVPAHMVDILNLASAELGATPDFSKVLIKYYVHTLSLNEKKALHLEKYLQNDLAKGPSQKRISLKGIQVYDDLNILKERSRMESTTDVLKAVVINIYEDFFDKPKKGVIETLRGLASASF